MTTMEDTFKIRKDKIKNIAIIFLTVMLILTFFSNSILNYSLPEVATQYVQSGTITEKVRGTGIVTADDPYKIVVSDSRVIESVAVKKGDEVEKDQVLFVLEDKDSDELTKAREELDALVFAYAQKILSGDISNTAFQNAQNGNIASISAYQGQIQAANDKVTAATTKVNTLTNDASAVQKQIDILGNKVVDTTSEENALAKAQENLRAAQKTYDLATNDVNWYSVSDNNINSDSAWENSLNDAKNRQKAASDDVTNKKYEVDSAQANLDKVKNTTSDTTTKADLSNQLTEIKANLAAATTALETAKTEQAAVVKDIQSQLDLGNQNSLIADKQEEVAKLEEKATGATINAPVAGIVTDITKVAGETTVPEDTIATIQVAGKGFTVNFSVTNEQAKKVQVGDVADLQNAWYYEDVKATLAKIKPDTEDPGKKKQLVFNVEGTIQDGESLSLSLGKQSANYDYVVPNSAVREDKNGKFILIIEEKSTPFGNRYKAKRVDAEVLAADDNQTAISAQLEGYEYVITTSNKPVEEGKQVRLADN